MISLLSFVAVCVILLAVWAYGFWKSRNEIDPFEVRRAFYLMAGSLTGIASAMVVVLYLVTN